MARCVQRLALQGRINTSGVQSTYIAQPSSQQPSLSLASPILDPSSPHLSSPKDEAHLPVLIETARLPRVLDPTEGTRPAAGCRAALRRRRGQRRHSAERGERSSGQKKRRHAERALAGRGQDEAGSGKPTKTLGVWSSAGRCAGRHSELTRERGGRTPGLLSPSSMLRR